MEIKWNYPKEKVLRGGLFGSGQVTKYHMNAWKSIDNVEIVAIANRTPEKAFALAKIYGIDAKKVYSSHIELLEKEDIEFVDIATAPQIHFEQVADSIRCGKHILCQKPFSLDLKSAKEMINLAKEKGVLLAINENWRWRSWYIRIKNLIDEGILGKPRYLYIRGHNCITLPLKKGKSPELAEKQPYTKDMEKLILLEWGIHIVDVARFLFGEPSSVYASAFNVSSFFKGEDRIVLMLDFSEAHVFIDLSWASIGSQSEASHLEHIDIEGDQGSIRIHPECDCNIHVNYLNKKNVFPAYSLSKDEEYQLSYTKTHEDFIKALRSGTYPETHAQDNFKTLAIVFAAYHSAKINQVVNIQEYTLTHSA